MSARFTNGEIVRNKRPYLNEPAWLIVEVDPVRGKYFAISVPYDGNSLNTGLRAWKSIDVTDEYYVRVPQCAYGKSPERSAPEAESRLEQWFGHKYWEQTCIWIVGVGGFTVISYVLWHTLKTALQEIFAK